MKLSVKNLQNWVFGNNGNYLAKKFTRFRIFPRISLLVHTHRHSREDFRKFLAKANDKILSYLAKTFKKLDFCQKWQFFRQKNPGFWISHGYLYSHTLEDTWETTLGSFHPKLMTKNEVICQKPTKDWILGKNGHFLTLFGQKSPILNFPTGATTHTHTSRHLGEDFRKF